MATLFMVMFSTFPNSLCSRAASAPFFATGFDRAEKDGK